jgi:aerobic-type carbon monoxide dehydrogenase small subunit (CoxS/CutS family)
MANVTALNVNGKKLTVDVDPQTNLLTVLRNDLNLTGTKYGCGESQCGACTVLIDGQQTRSCVTPVGKVANRQITTIEGLEKDGQLHPLQEAFLQADAMQCGYCTSGMLISAAALLSRCPNPSEEQVREALEPHLCRCGVYGRMIRAVRQAAAR